MALCVRQSSCLRAVAGQRSIPRCLGAVRPLTARKTVVRVAASSQNVEAAYEQVGKIATLSAVASSWMLSGNAQAATELASVAGSDNRISVIALLFLPVVGWVGFNMLQPALNQLNRMNEAKGEGGVTLKKATKATKAIKKKRSFAGAAGLGAALTLFAAQQADAATELSQLAASDNRLGTISLLFLPALGWVGFNMLQPALNQLNRMNDARESAAPTPSKKKRSVAGAAGLGAALTLFAAQQADAATELSQLAASDNRLGVISLLFLPVVGWVGFNMLQPALNQLNRMNEAKGEGGVTLKKATKVAKAARR